MGFHDDNRVQELIQSHIEQISNLEKSEAEKLRKRYREIRRELRDRLDTAQSDTFTAQKLRSILLQVESALEAMRKGLLDGMGESAKKAAVLGSEKLVLEVERFDNIFTGAAREINVDKILVASDTSKFLFNRYDASLKAYSAGLRADVARSLSDMAIQELSLGETVSRIGRFFIGEEWKILRLARTEIHHVYNMSRQNTLFKVADDDRELKKTLFHPMDSRTGKDSKQAKAKNLIVDVDKPFKYTFKRRLSDGTIVEEDRIFMVPPDRPNDRSIMVPYKNDWDLNA